MCVFVFTVSTVSKAMKSRALTAKLAMVNYDFQLVKKMFWRRERDVFMRLSTPRLTMLTRRVHRAFEATHLLRRCLFKARGR